MSAVIKGIGNVFDHIPSSDVSGGTVIKVGNLLGIAIRPVLANEKGAFGSSGLLSVNRETDVEFTAGDIVYFNLTTQEATDDDTKEPLGFYVEDNIESPTDFIIVLMPPTSITVVVGGGGGGGDLLAANNLDDLDDIPTALTNLGKDSTGGFAGLTLFKINFKNALNTITSFFTNANTVARTYLFQDRDGTIADDTDIAGANTYADGKVADAINNGTTTVAPSQNAVFDALALKLNVANPSITGNLQLSEDGGILFDQTLSADGSFSISKGELSTLGETLVFGELVYFKQSDSRWWKFDSDTESTSANVKLGIICQSGNAGDDRLIMLEGKIRADSQFPTLAVGAKVYGGSTAGAIQVAKPTTGFVRCIGFGNTADCLYFNPSNEHYEIGETVVAFTAGSGTITIHSAADTITWKKESGYCTVTGYLLVSGVSTPSGAWNMTGLPYISKSGNQSRTGFGANASGLNFGDSIPVVAYVPEGNSVVTIQKVTNGVLGNLAGDVVTNTELVLGFTYPTST